MGDLLSPTRLYWNGTGGSARHDGVRVELRHPPRIVGLPRGVCELEFAPHEHVTFVREKPHMERRDLTPAEIGSIRVHLAHMAEAARRVVDEQ